jgi:hypothetical protein
VETQDDVQIFRCTDKSPFKRKFGSLYDMAVGQVKRAVIMAAVKREWTLYVDALEELAARIKSDPRGGLLQQNQWKELLEYIDIQIRMRGGPLPEECGMNLARVQANRRGGSEKRILLV